MRKTLNFQTSNFAYLKRPLPHDPSMVNGYSIPSPYSLPESMVIDWDQKLGTLSIEVHYQIGNNYPQDDKQYTKTIRFCNHELLVSKNSFRILRIRSIQTFNKGTFLAELNEITKDFPRPDAKVLLEVLAVEL